MNSIDYTEKKVITISINFHGLFELKSIPLCPFICMSNFFKKNNFCHKLPNMENPIYTLLLEEKSWFRLRI